MDCDHWIAVKDTRPDNPGSTATNILPLCHSSKGVGFGDPGCNNTKHKRDPVEWVIEKFGKQKAAKVIQDIETYFEWVRHRKAA